MEDDLNKLFAELERQQINISIYTFNHGSLPQINVSLDIPDSKGGNSLLTVRASGQSVRTALADAYFRVMQLQQAMEFKPEPTDDWVPPSLPDDDEIPF